MINERIWLGVISVMQNSPNFLIATHLFSVKMVGVFY